MDPRESGQLTLDQEMRHWWISSRFIYLSEVTPRSGSILEVGAGTGQNIRFLAERKAKSPEFQSHLAAFEPLWSSLPNDRLHPLPTEVQRYSKWQDLPPQQRYDFIFSMDVLEHIDNDIDALKTWSEKLSTHGTLFVSVPALQSLWSSHDAKLGHFRRYSRKSLISAAQKAGLVPDRIWYAFGPLTPAVYIARRFFSVFQRKSDSDTDLKMPSRWINWSLLQVCKLEARLGGNPWFGTSVMAQFRRAKK